MLATVYGGGSWGTALAHVLASSGHKVRLLLRDRAVAAAVNATRENPRYLPGLPLHQGVEAVTDLLALAGSDIWVLAVPCQSQRQVLAGVAALLGPECVVINASKGIELSSLKPMSEVAAEALGFPGGFSGRYAVLSGPSFAREVMEGKPTAVVLGCENERQGARLREVFATPRFRSYSSRDVRGVELGGAVKNIIAIAAGVSDGLGFGNNARAALLTRGLAEISRLGAAMGARPATFMGLSGLGDLMLTCTGDLSRNRQVGLRLAGGESLERITATMKMVAEGVKTTAAVHRLAARLGVEMPITAAMNGVLAGALAPQDAVAGLMLRSLKEEGT
jgi:glycerol-3-phosphate dehydrogenase (NAD(P)+)